MDFVIRKKHYLTCQMMLRNNFSFLSFQNIVCIEISDMWLNSVMTVTEPVCLCLSKSQNRKADLNWSADQLTHWHFYLLQGPIKMKQALLMHLTTNQSNSSSPTRCISIYLCGKMNQGRTRVQQEEPRARRTQPPPPAPPAPPHSTHPPTAWSAATPAAAPTPFSMAAPPSWHPLHSVLICERSVRTLPMKNLSLVRRRRKKKACFSAPLASAAAPALQADAHEKMKFPPHPWTCSPCHPFLSATPPSAFCSQISRVLGLTWWTRLAVHRRLRITALVKSCTQLLCKSSLLEQTLDWGGRSLVLLCVRMVSDDEELCLGMVVIFRRISGDWY